MPIENYIVQYFVTFLNKIYIVKKTNIINIRATNYSTNLSNQNAKLIFFSTSGVVCQRVNWHILTMSAQESYTPHHFPHMIFTLHFFGGLILFLWCFLPSTNITIPDILTTFLRYFLLEIRFLLLFYLVLFTAHFIYLFFCETAALRILFLECFVHLPSLLYFSNFHFCSNSNNNNCYYCYYNYYLQKVSFRITFLHKFM